MLLDLITYHVSKLRRMSLHTIVNVIVVWLWYFQSWTQSRVRILFKASMLFIVWNRSTQSSVLKLRDRDVPYLRQSPAFYCAGSGSFPGSLLRGLWWTEWHHGAGFSPVTVQRLWYSRPICGLQCSQNSGGSLQWCGPPLSFKRIKTVKTINKPHHESRIKGNLGDP
jgi:hypothetical protein